MSSSNNTSGNHSECTDHTHYSRSNKSRNSYDSGYSDDYTYTDTRDGRDSQDSCDSRDHHSYGRSSCDKSRDCHKRKRHCKNDCGLKCSGTLVGVWNLIFQFESTTSTSSTTLDQPTQLLLNEGGTFTNHSTPDLKNNPFNALLTTRVGVWHPAGDRKLKLESTTIAYKASDGSPILYYKVHITMKFNHKGTRARFCGKAVPKSLDDPTLCTDASAPVICFSGCGWKVLEPRKCE